ncbi:MAG: hypothetical protein COT71_03745 [Candidatus Andersenbacteria bacterium CG10_big_fil_rev_8_21_14_0_10_54_11]|uniref:Peptidoglycan hydrolase PcsB coiled-coil domain-containing protein n=1 Tax=Candidatus Andersenbacteria bacterium CG10_big_fil_rev_8_21_14_0_10_54_11 TaxID=1974485 RepID=A0A2M6WYK1_9BACT|nr:MAG: hypothetical protein COT71_03745 [Candidatus Andersenbacteria bacterium CG10_big_fil_rev_8_21_14_0_10_54_11]
MQHNQAELAAKQAELAALEQKIKDFEQKEDSAAAQAELAGQKAKRLQQEVAATRLILRQTELSINNTEASIQETETAISDRTERIERMRETLRETLRELYERRDVSFIDVMLGEQTLSQFIAERDAFAELQSAVQQLMNQLKREQADLEAQGKQLAERSQELYRLKEAQGFQQGQLTSRQREQERFQQLKTKEQSRYEQQAAEARDAQQEIKQDIFTLKGVGLQIAANDAYSAARYASALTGVRPALLLAVLKVETNVGEKLGSGRFPDDMHPQSRDAFIRITRALGLDPAVAPISARPRSYQGWGGAMGPGQFMPATWETIAVRVGQKMNKPVPDPYELVDSFVATGVMLADRGGATRDGEFEAVSRYLAGPNWMYHAWYGNRVLAVAAEYEKEGL